MSVSWLAYFTLTHAFFPPWVFIGLTPTWSLTVEECFYVTAPVVFLLVSGYMFFTELFISSQADMRPFFGLAPLIFCFFAPLDVGMVSCPP